MTEIPGTGLHVAPLNLGGNVFGWTASEAASFAILDAYADAGGNFIDTADVYPAWAPGNAGGESETIIGRWMRARGNRDGLVIATKVAAHKDFRGLSAANIPRAAEASLRRLGTDRIDLYYAHYDDPAVPVEETVRAFDSLLRAGKIRAAGASNLPATRLSESLAVARAGGLAGYSVVQYEYNLMERDYERELAGLVQAAGLGMTAYYSLASGYLTGKYRGPASPRGARSQAAGKYARGRGPAVLAALDVIAAAHGVRPAAVALAWLRAQPTVTAPIASVSQPGQLADLLPFAGLVLTDGELAELSAITAP